MLPKKNRTTKKEVDIIFKKGSTISGPFLFLKYNINTSNQIPKVSFITPKKVEKGAVGRNKLKRMGYLAIHPLLKTIPVGFCGVFTFKDKNLSQKELDINVKKIIDKIN